MFKLKIGATLMALVIVYLPVSFIAWSFNPAYWSDGLRLIYIVGFVILFILIYGGAKTELLRRARAEYEKGQPERERKAGGFRAMLQGQLDKAEQARREQERNSN